MALEARAKAEMNGGGYVRTTLQLQVALMVDRIWMCTLQSALGTKQFSHRTREGRVWCVCQLQKLENLHHSATRIQSSDNKWSLNFNCFDLNSPPARKHSMNKSTLNGNVIRVSQALNDVTCQKKNCYFACIEEEIEDWSLCQVVYTRQGQRTVPWPSLSLLGRGS